LNRIDRQVIDRQYGKRVPVLSSQVSQDQESQDQTRFHQDSSAFCYLPIRVDRLPHEQGQYRPIIARKKGLALVLLGTTPFSITLGTLQVKRLDAIITYG